MGLCVISLEQELKDYFKKHSFEYIDNSSDFKLLDFTLLKFLIDKREDQIVFRKLYLEVKEKRQKYNISNWKTITADNEKHTFIIDELSTRKILAYAPFSGLLVRNNLTEKYYWYSVLDLFLMPKSRANRPIKKYADVHMKGKLILDFRNGVECTFLDEVFVIIKSHIENRSFYYTSMTECYGQYFNEIIPEQGVLRNPVHWDIDVSQTR